MKIWKPITKVPCVEHRGHSVIGDKGRCRFCKKQYRWTYKNGYEIRVNDD